MTARPPLRTRLTAMMGETEMWAFLRTPQEPLGDATPASLILEDRGEEVHDLLDRLERGLER